MATKIREVALEDAGECAEIYRPIVEQSIISFEETAPDADEFKRRIASVTEHYPWLVALSNDRVVGYAYGHRHRERAAYRYAVEVSVYVDEGERGNGVGRKLYDALLAQLRERKFHQAFAGIALPNEASEALHARCGFIKIGVFREIGRKFDRWIDVSWWQRAL